MMEETRYFMKSLFVWLFDNDCCEGAASGRVWCDDLREW